jgi:hypothetical protein
MISAHSRSLNIGFLIATSRTDIFTVLLESDTDFISASTAQTEAGLNGIVTTLENFSALGKRIKSTVKLPVINGRILTQK